jgi:hypothetical protein
MRQTNTQRPTAQQDISDGLSNKVCDLLSLPNSGTESDENRSWVFWSMHADTPNPTNADVVFDTEDGEGGVYCKPLNQSELNSVVYADRPWELHMEFDGRAIKKDPFNQLRRMVCHSRHGNSSAVSRIEICTPDRRATGSTWPLQIKRVEVFEANATVHDVLTRIAGGMCYGFFEGMPPRRDGMLQNTAFQSFSSCSILLLMMLLWVNSLSASHPVAWR